jgi:hypothetical protein
VPGEEQVDQDLRILLGERVSNQVGELGQHLVALIVFDRYQPEQFEQIAWSDAGEPGEGAVQMQHPRD